MRAGVLYGIGAYGLWGLFPLYFHLLDDVAPIDVLANRIVWSLLVVLGILVGGRRIAQLRAVVADRRALRLLMASGALIALNWGLYIYAVSADHVLEAALGYFITPLVSVGFGMAFFGERLRPAQTAALALGTIAVAVLTAAAGHFPWISIVLAATFGTYGLLKKLAGVGAAESLAVETLTLAGPALILIAALALTGDGSFAADGLSTTLLLVAAGPVTAIPLILFAACVTRVPLSMVGLLQYLTPVGQFLIGWLALSEPMTAERWIGFALVWAGLTALTWDGLRHGGDDPRAAAEELETEYA
jgi:chloramphenicol-sensitive protein RarD